MSHVTAVGTHFEEKMQQQPRATFQIQKGTSIPEIYAKTIVILLGDLFLHTGNINGYDQFYCQTKYIFHM